jgi:hypothetical protein
MVARPLCLMTTLLRIGATGGARWAGPPSTSCA